MSRPPPAPMAGAYLVAAIAFVARLALFAGLELYPDEAYYWTWSLRPAFGYYDHPPMVAYLAWLGSFLPGETGLRVPFALCGALTIVFTSYSARRLSSHPRAPLWAALFAATAPMLTVGGALVLPDAPLQAACAAATWLVIDVHGRRWLLLGIAVGLALLSKYSAGLLALAALPAAGVDATFRAELRTRWPWLAVVLAVLVFAPCLAWNAAHDFASIRFQFRHGLGGADTSRLGEFIGGVLGGAGPLVLAAAAIFFARTRTPAARRLLMTTAVPLAVFAWAALRGSAEANWPALVYPTVCAAAGALVAGSAAKTARVLGVATVVFGAGAAVVYAAEVRSPHLVRPGAAAVQSFHGWRDMTAAVQRLAGEPVPFVVASNYQIAAELAFYGGFRRFGPTFRRPSQFDVWGATPAPGERVMVVSLKQFHAKLDEMLREPPPSPVKVEIRFAGALLRTIWVTVDGVHLKEGPAAP